MDRAAGLAAKLLDAHDDQIASVTIVPSTGGVFDVEVDGKLVFSKKAQGRFPEYEEVDKAFS